MGRKDMVTGAYVKQNTIFADAFNYYIFGGQQVIRPEQLKELDTAEIVVPYGADGAGEPEQKYRDVMKSLTAMQDENAAYLLLGIENQSDVHYAMPVKNLVYDTLHYAKQVQEAANSHRKAKDYKEHGKGEFLSGFYKEDKLIPVITLVIFFSPDEWDGPTSLHDMMNVKDERILSLVPDYQIHLIAPAGLSDEELEKFHSSLKEVLGFIKYANDMKKMDRIVHGNFHKLRREEIDVLNQCVNVKLELKDGEETVDVCKAWEDMKREAAKEAAEEATIKATKETQEETLLQNLRSLMETLHFSAEQAMAALKVPESRRAQLSAKL